MISAFAKAIAQLPEPEFRRALLLSLLLSLVVLAGLAGVVWWALYDLGVLSLGWPFSWFVEGAVWLVFGVVTLVLFPAVVTTFVAFFLEGVVKAVEDKHYPNDPPGHDVPIGRSLVVGINYTLVLVAVNLVGLILYLPLSFFPIFSLVVFSLLNGYLLGREYFELVALRHLDDETARTMRRRHSWRLTAVGTVIAFLFPIPILNLVMPLIAAAAMVHVFKRLQARATRRQMSGEPA